MEMAGKNSDHYNMKCCPRDMTSEWLGKIFEGDFEDTCTEQFPQR
jgi:hypothetical protein